MIRGTFQTSVSEDEPDWGTNGLFRTVIVMRHRAHGTGFVDPRGTFDGGVAPGLYAPELGRNDAPGHGGYGPIIAVVE